MFPPDLLAQGLKLLSDATATPEDPGVSWSGRTKCAFNDTECVITMVRLLLQNRASLLDSSFLRGEVQHCESKDLICLYMISVATFCPLPSLL